MIHVDIEQNTDAWFSEKLGKPSASNADRIMTDDLKPSKQREAYLYELAAERVTGQRDMAGYSNRYMEIGHERQEEAKKLYEIMYDYQVTPAGVCYPDEKKRYLCSPDGLILGSHGVEIKNPAPKTQVKWLIKNELPSEHMPQIQFSLMVTGFEFWDFTSYSPALNPLNIRIYRNEKYISSLREATEIFCDTLDKIVEKINA